MTVPDPGAKSPTAIPPDLMPTLIGTALACAELAREVIRPYFRAHPHVANKKGPGDYDPVTEADRAAEEAIRRYIKSYFPTHGIVGEGFGYEQGASRIKWVIDPIDGTRSFLCGTPIWGTLIAVNDGQRPVIGVMDQGYTGERFLGVPGASYCIGPDTPLALDTLPQLETSGITSLAETRLASTDPAMFKTQRQRAAFEALQARAPILRYGLDCYAYAMLAMGHIDLVVEAGLKPYDIQALIPIVEGAGGVVTDWSGESAQDGGEVVAAATPELHGEALRILSGR